MDFIIQPTRKLHTLRVDNGWLVWLHGSPHTTHHTYLHLFDNGRIERVSEGDGGSINLVVVKEEDK